jgi:tetratricopeptide (TPR) repeat protein
MIVAGAKHLPDSLKNAVSNPLELDDIVGELGKYSLVEVDKGRRTISIHRLVQAVVRNKLSSEERQTWAEAGLHVVNAGFSYELNDMSTWPIAAIVLPHGLAVIASFDLQEPSSREVGAVLSRILNDLGVYLRHRAQYIDARSQIARALAIDEAMYGPDHPTVAIRLSNLGSLLQDLGDLQGARSYYERALAIGEAMYGPDHPTVAIRLNNLGSVLKDLGDLPGARSHLERALAIDEAVYGPDHPQVAVALSILGIIFWELGDLPAARSNFEKAVAIGQTVYGLDHPEAATWLGNLGAVLVQQGKLQEGQRYLTNAYAIFYKYLGPDHPRTTNSRAWLEHVIRLNNQNAS